jgi:hypothetical protein
MTRQQITMTPVASIRKLGLSGGLAGAVELTPSGLAFTVPAVLRIRTSQSAPAGQRMVGFTAADEFSKRALSLAAADGGEIAVLVSHFSSSGAGFGTTSDANQFPTIPSGTLEQSKNLILALTTPWDAAAEAHAVQLANQAFEDIVFPGLENAATDPGLLDAIGDYWTWRYLLNLIANGGQVPIASLVGGGADLLTVPPAFAPDDANAREAAADGIKLAVGGNIHVCGTQASLQALKNVFFWHENAADFGVNDAAHGLDLPTIQTDIENNCARVVLLNSNLPAELDQGAQFDLDLRFGLAYNNGAREPTDFQVDLDGSGIGIQHPSGATGIGDGQNPLGSYRTVITGASSGTIVINTEACLALTERTPPQPDPQPRLTGICGTRCVIGGVPAGAEQSGTRAARSAEGDDTCEELYFNDFSGTIGAEWSPAPAATTPSGERFLGELETVTLELADLPEHSSLILEFEVYIIASWNGNGCLECTGDSRDPDVVFVDAAGPGAARVLQTTFSNKPRDKQAYPGAFPGGENPAGTGSTARNTLGYPVGPDFFGDSRYRIRITFPHTGESLALAFGAEHSGAIERWGLDNVRVRRLP